MPLVVVYLLIGFIALMAAVKVVFQNDFSRNFGKNFADMSLYLSFAFLFIAVMMLFMVDYSALPSWQTIVMGVAFGVIAAVTQIIYTFAMKNGPVSLTVLIINFNLVIPIATGMIFWGESVSPLQWVGLLILAVSMVLILYEKPKKKVVSASGEPKKHRYTVWLICTAVTFVLFGLNAVIQVWHQHIPEIKHELEWFVCISYAVAGVFSLLVVPCSRQKISFKFNLRVIIDVVCGAIALGLYNYIKPMLSNYVENDVLQPLSAILNILFITIFGVLLFKDKLTKQQWVGFGISLVSIVLLCL